MRPVAEVRTYEELQSAIAARRREMGLSQLAMDDLTGLPTGYSGKLECRPGLKNSKVLGPISLPLVLGALRLKLVLVEDAEAAA